MASNSNEVILDETGRYPIQILRQLRMTKYGIKLSRKGSQSKVTHINVMNY